MQIKNILVLCYVLLSTNVMVASNDNNEKKSCWKSLVYLCCSKQSAEETQTHNDYVVLRHEPLRNQQAGIAYEDHKGGSYTFNPLRRSSSSSSKNILPTYKKPSHFSNL